MLQKWEMKMENYFWSNVSCTRSEAWLQKFVPGSAVMRGDCRELAACATLRSCATPGILTREWDKRDQKYQFKFQITNLSLAVVEIVQLCVVLQRRWMEVTDDDACLHQVLMFTVAYFTLTYYDLYSWLISGLGTATPRQERSCIV